MEALEDDNQRSQWEIQVRQRVYPAKTIMYGNTPGGSYVLSCSDGFGNNLRGIIGTVQFRLADPNSDLVRLTVAFTVVSDMYDHQQVGESVRLMTDMTESIPLFPQQAESPGNEVSPPASPRTDPEKIEAVNAHTSKEGPPNINPPPETPKTQKPDMLPLSPASSFDADSLYRLGRKQLADNDREGARESFRRAAGLQHTDSMVILGAIYSEERNYHEAATMFRQAADLGNPRGMYNLGVLYEKGEGVTNSLEDAAHWYELANKLGDRDAAYRLGTMYERGVGGRPKDFQKARDLYQQAGTPEAKSRLAMISGRLP
jgi:TPR repeat protein